LNGHDQWFADFFQIRHRFGCYDEISGNGPRRVRHCNWVRFVRVANSFNPAVNFVATKVRGEPVYEAVKPISPDTELLVYYLPERPEELFFVRMRASLYRQTMDSILEGIYCPERIHKNKKILLKGEHTSRELPIN
jgi:hypothetical protein